MDQIVAAMNAMGAAAGAASACAVEQMLTVEEVAPQVRMSRQGLYAAIREGQFPAVRIGSRIRIPLSALSRWIEQQMNGGGK